MNNPFLKTYEETKAWLDQAEISSYTIDNELEVTVEGDVLILSMGLKFIPVKFKKVTGNFYCYNNFLSSLMGCPQEVGKDFIANNNRLTSLDGAPKKVGENFFCTGNYLKDLKGGPQIVGESYDVADNKLISLHGAPKKINVNFNVEYNELKSLLGAPEVILGDFYCAYNKLTSLEGCPTTCQTLDISSNNLKYLTGLPQSFNGDLKCAYNKLLSLKDFPKQLNNLVCNNNQLISLKGLPQINGYLNCAGNPLIQFNEQKIHIEVDIFFSYDSSLKAMECFESYLYSDNPKEKFKVYYLDFSDFKNLMERRQLMLEMEKYLPIKESKTPKRKI